MISAEFLRDNTGHQHLTIKDVQPNPMLTYKRIIHSMSWVDPEVNPVLFHTAASELQVVSPLFCQSYDYLYANGSIANVVFVLPYPHANRVKGASEIMGPHKMESISKGGVPYTYYKVGNLGQIRMASTMEDTHLLALLNTGHTYKMSIIEVNPRGKFPLTEYISFSDLPVIDSYRFTSPSPILPAMGGWETHLPLDIPTPQTGYVQLTEYLQQLKSGGIKSKIIDAANAVAYAATHPSSTMALHSLVMENINARFRRHESRYIISLIPLEDNTLEYRRVRNQIDAFCGWSEFFNAISDYHHFLHLESSPRLKKAKSLIHDLQEQFIVDPIGLAFIELYLDSDYFFSTRDFPISEIYNSGETVEQIFEKINAITDLVNKKNLAIVMKIAQRFHVPVYSFYKPKKHASISDIMYVLRLGGT